MNTEIPKGMKIKRLPAGKAYGANDLTNWSNRRTVGKCGVFDGKEFKKEKKRAKKLSKISGNKVKPFK